MIQESVRLLMISRLCIIKKQKKGESTMKTNGMDFKNRSNRTHEISIIRQKLNFFNKVFPHTNLEPPNHLRYVMTFTAIVLGVFGYDLITNRESDRSKRI